MKPGLSKPIILSKADLENDEKMLETALGNQAQSSSCLGLIFFWPRISPGTELEQRPGPGSVVLLYLDRDGLLSFLRCLDIKEGFLKSECSFNCYDTKFMNYYV